MTLPQMEPVRRSRADDIVKRFIDIVVSLVALVVLSPVLGAVALAVRLDSPGPVIYRARRSGLRGAPFDMFKFRTMYAGAVAPRKGLTTALNDPRVTRIGKKLRHWKLDELPQFVNILRGEMSLVGPRPEMPYYTDQYVGEELLILTVRPGITDFSSAYFYNLQEIVGSGDADEAFEQHVLPVKNQLRLRYVKERSLRVDIGLLLETAWILTRRALRLQRPAVPDQPGEPLLGHESAASTTTPNSSQPRDRQISGATTKV